MRTVTVRDVDACIRENGLYGWSTSDLRQLVREAAAGADHSAHIRQAAARQVLVAKLKETPEADNDPVGPDEIGSVLGEYTRLHMEFVEMLNAGRLSKSMLKDDYHCLINALDRINQARRAGGINEIPLGDNNH